MNIFLNKVNPIILVLVFTFYGCTTKSKHTMVHNEKSNKIKNYENTNKIKNHESTKKIDKEQEEILRKQANLYVQTKLSSETLQGAKYLANTIWQDQSINIRHDMMNYQDAREYCSSLIHLNSNKWKLPSLKNLRGNH